MTRPEFAAIMAYIAAATGKSLSADATEVYYELLGDLPAPVLRVTAKRVVLEHKWATFPTVAELREAAILTASGEVVGLSPAEAWDLAWSAAKKIDLEVEGSLQRACARLPPLVVEAMRVFGIATLCSTRGDPVGVVRAQFLKIYEQLQTRDHRVALLPAAVRREIAAASQAARVLPAPLSGLLENIGTKAG